MKVPDLHIPTFLSNFAKNPRMEDKDHRTLEYRIKNINEL